MTSETDNVFNGCEDSFFAKAVADWEKERNVALEKAACKLEKKKLMIASDRYLDTLELMQTKAGETEMKISGMFEEVKKNVIDDAAEIEMEAEKCLRAIKRQSSRTEKIVKLTSREQRVKLVTLLASAFLGGIVLTVFVYHAFIIGIMNKYLHHTIEVMAQAEINEAKREAELILRNANIKADGILKNADSFAGSKNDKSLETGGKK